MPPFNTMILLIPAGVILSLLSTVIVRSIAQERTNLAVGTTMLSTFINISSLAAIIALDDLLSKLLFVAGIGLGTYIGIKITRIRKTKDEDEPIVEKAHRTFIDSV